MSDFTKTITEQFHVVSCYCCGIRFGITDQLHRRVVINAEGSVYCPSCGRQSAWRESRDQKEIKRLQREIDTERRRADTAIRRAERESERRESVEKSLSATKGVVTRIKNRVGKGVCPCCNRTFRDLARHMANQHPEFSGEEGEA